MSLFSRAHDIVSAKANRALDSAENPNEMRLLLIPVGCVAIVLLSRPRCGAGRQLA